MEKNNFIWILHVFKKIFCILIAIVALVRLLPSQSHAITFTDLAWYQYADSVQFLADRGVVKWYPDGSFGVNWSISRAELLKIILEWVGALSLYGTGESGNVQLVTEETLRLQNCFPDVTTQWYAPYICYAKEKGIAKWYPDGTFKPDNKVTIAEWLKMTINTFDVGVKEGIGEMWYTPYMDFVHNNNIFSKYAIYPWSALTRGQMALLVHTLILNKEWTKPFTNVRIATSDGCGKPMPVIAPTESIVNGLARHYITVVGRNYSPNSPTKLIIAVHGRTNPNTQVQTYYGIDRASEGNAIIVYPLWLPEEWPTRNRADPGDKIYALRDYAFFDQLVKEFKTNYCINTDEIYVMWHSLWGRFTNALGCFRGDVIRGIGTVWSSSIGNQSCVWPVEAVVMHNPADNLASYAGWVATRDLFLKNNGCNPDSAVPYTSPDTAQCVQYSCVTGAPVVRCPYTDATEWWSYYPHVWPKYAWQLIRDFWKKNE